MRESHEVGEMKRGVRETEIDVKERKKEWGRDSREERESFNAAQKREMGEWGFGINKECDFWFSQIFMLLIT
jgi:hypothetical protein